MSRSRGVWTVWRRCDNKNFEVRGAAQEKLRVKRVLEYLAQAQALQSEPNQSSIIMPADIPPILLSAVYIQLA